MWSDSAHPGAQGGWPNPELEGKRRGRWARTSGSSIAVGTRYPRPWKDEAAGRPSRLPQAGQLQDEAAGARISPSGEGSEGRGRHPSPGSEACHQGRSWAPPPSYLLGPGGAEAVNLRTAPSRTSPPQPSQPVWGGSVEGEGCLAREPGVQGFGGYRMWAALADGELRPHQGDWICHQSGAQPCGPPAAITSV